MSGKVMAILRIYDPNMSMAGCDESYLKQVILFLPLGAPGHACSM